MENLQENNMEHDIQTGLIYGLVVLIVKILHDLVTLSYQTSQDIRFEGSCKMIGILRR